MFKGEHYRITVLTERLIRLEYSETDEFTDGCTQTVVCRDFPEVSVKEGYENGIRTLETEALLLRYDEKPFSPDGLSIYLKEKNTTWHYSIVYGNSDRNLLGTARTLDMTDGFLPLENGIFGENGYAVIDDSDTAVFEDGEFVERKAPETDLYFFGYGDDFYGGLKDFYRLSGETPLVPRYALGNWWSRYYRYSEESYLSLLDRMEEEKIPLSVSVIDMDWHVTEVDPKYGTGWTGYSWNRELFPEPNRFLHSLKDRKMAVTLNLHPADGIRAFEDMYPAVAKRMGIDPESEKAVEFDFSDRTFRDAYFEEVMHPFEDEGVDFWWIDWQQGTKRGGSDVDPLFLLNHYHFEDRKGRDCRPMIFSRYAGVGSHRYPLGFSGDTLTTWRSLAFQPYFTSTASNIGYGWWSHDIGGHMLGDKDEERLARWVQLGVFSPIMRLHSSNSPFFNKEPWNVSEPYRSVMGDFLRLRRRLIPYLYTMNERAHGEGIPLVEPVYYREPGVKAAYDVKNEFFFGTNLLVGAITEPEDPMLRMAKVNLYLPEGRWFDILTGQIYEGGIRRNFYRGIKEIPVLLPASGILPLDQNETDNGTENPKALSLLLGAGADGEFTLYEDDGVTMAYENGASVRTAFTLKQEKEGLRFTIHAAEGELSLIPEKRSYELVIYGLSKVAAASLQTSSGAAGEELPVQYDEDRQILSVTLPETEVTREQTVILSGAKPGKNDREMQVFTILENAWCETLEKERVYQRCMEAESDEDFLNWLSASDISPVMKDALTEVFADGSE